MDFRSIILDYAARFETHLVKRYGASGRGLHEKINSVEGRLSDQLVRQLRFVGTTRNKAVHEADFVPQNVEATINTCKYIEAEFGLAPTPLGHQPTGVVTPPSPVASVSAKRDQLRQLHQRITELQDANAFNDPRLPALIAEYVRINPNDPAMCDLAKKFPGKPGQLWTSSLGMKFALVPSGTFWMGGTAGTAGTRQVDIAQAFYLGIYQVTQEQWQRVMGNHPSRFSGADRNQLPVEQVSWDDAQQFIKKMNAREQDAGWVYRLPTETEWEYACRGAARSKEECSFDFYFDKPTNELSPPRPLYLFQVSGSSDKANFRANFHNWLHETTKVGSFLPNRLGVFDMHGNVWEWCDDLYEEGPDRVIRGGSWVSTAEDCRAASRSKFSPSNRSNQMGFRLARVPTTSK